MTNMLFEELLFVLSSATFPEEVLLFLTLTRSRSRWRSSLSRESGKCTTITPGMGEQCKRVKNMLPEDARLGHRDCVASWPELACEWSLDLATDCLGRPNLTPPHDILPSRLPTA